MKRNAGALGAVALVVVLFASVSAVSVGPIPEAVAGPAAAPAQLDVARGEYLVMKVAMCVQCHSPRDARGELVHSQLLQGAPMPAAWPGSPKPWAYAAPKLAGLPAGFTEATLATFLQTGERTAGYQARPPMPPFRMNEADAMAVVAYLKSLR